MALVVAGWLGWRGINQRQRTPLPLDEQQLTHKKCSQEPHSGECHIAGREIRCLHRPPRSRLLTIDTGEVHDLAFDGVRTNTGKSAGFPTAKKHGNANGSGRVIAIRSFDTLVVSIFGWIGAQTAGRCPIRFSVSVDSSFVVRPPPRTMSDEGPGGESPVRLVKSNNYL